MESPHYHHSHFNAANPTVTIKFYKDFLVTIEVKYSSVADALLAERSAIPITKVARAALPTAPDCILTHEGWAGVAVSDEYEWFNGRCRHVRWRFTWTDALAR